MNTLLYVGVGLLLNLFLSVLFLAIERRRWARISSQVGIGALMLVMLASMLLRPHPFFPVPTPVLMMVQLLVVTHLVCIFWYRKKTWKEQLSELARNHNLAIFSRFPNGLDGIEIVEIRDSGKKNPEPIVDTSVGSPL